MKNSFWYYVLTAIGIMLIIFTLLKKKRVAELFAFFLASASVAYLLEVVVLFYLRGYDYKPEIFQDPIAESIIGHLLCNGFFWGGFMILSAAFSLRLRWILLFSAFFTLTEVFFLKKGLYVHHWWQLYYTSIGVVIVLTVCKKWLQWLRSNRYRLLRHVTFFYIAWILLAGPTIVLLIAGSQHFSSGLSDNFYLNDIFLDVPYHLLLSVILTLLISVFKKPFIKMAAFLVVTLGDWTLFQYHLLVFSGEWNLFYLVQLRFLCLLLYVLLEKHTFPLETAPSQGRALG